MAAPAPLILVQAPSVEYVNALRKQLGNFSCFRVDSEGVRSLPNRKVPTLLYHIYDQHEFAKRKAAKKAVAWDILPKRPWPQKWEFLSNGFYFIEPNGTTMNLRDPTGVSGTIVYKLSA